MAEAATAAPLPVAYFFDENIGIHASVEAQLLKPHILKCAAATRAAAACLRRF